MNEALHQAMAEIAGFLAAHPAVGNWYTAIVRFLFPVLAILIFAAGGAVPAAPARHA